MKNTSYLLLGAAIILLSIGGYVAYTHSLRTDTASSNATTTQSVSYASPRYGFTFDVPEGYSHKEYAPESVSVGTPQGSDGFDSIADVRVYTAGEVTGYASYDGFVTETLKNMCAADGPQETIYCDAVEETQPFASASGLTGEALYLRRIHENLATKASTTDTFGPIFVFNIGANVPSQQFAVLAVEPPANLPEDAVDMARVRAIAQSMKIDRVSASPRSDHFVLITDVHASATSTDIIADEVEYLEGDAARAAAASDTSCAPEDLDDCVPTLASGFYIRNTATATEAYPVSPRADILLQEEARPQSRTIGDLEGRLRENPTPLPANIQLQDGMVVHIEELYMP
jgi:hypothetical protein